MIKRGYKIISLVLICLFLFTGNSNGQGDVEDGRIRIAMRMIGDEVLKNSGDSTSRVLPIEREGDQYRISFESDFQFNPEELIKTTQAVFVQTKIAESYMVQVEECDNKKIVHGYEVRSVDHPDLLPCITRMQPKACYNILVNIVQPITVFDAAVAERLDPHANNKKTSATYLPFLMFFPLFALVGFFAYSWKKKREPNTDTNILSIGAYQFDKRNMMLSLEDNKVELTGKEADLLSLLHTSTNQALERETILKAVWGDEGDYVGRTLDVFISKLRKKLDGDTNVKIVNIRGVGYKLVVNG